MNPSALRLYVVADPDHCSGDLVRSVNEALHGGVTMVQLRAKSLTDCQQLVLARALRDVCAEHGVPFLVNDRLDIALASGADGIHIGVEDLPIPDVRRLAGPGFIIGYSPDTDGQIAASATLGANYLGIGPVYGTATKSDAGDALGIAEFARRCALSEVPVVGIGGINAANAREVMTAGAAGIALVSAVIGTDDPRAAALQLRSQVKTSVK